MMFSKKATLFILLINCFYITHILNSENTNEDSYSDPFKSLGIPNLNPKALLDEVEQETHHKKAKDGLQKLRTIEDLPNFLKHTQLTEEEAINVLTKFLIQDDYMMKKYGVVYDESGFDGVTTGERIAPIGTEERLMQRARSSSNIWVNIIFKYFKYFNI
jgi:hypothetical protein